MVKVLVCGDRDYTDYDHVCDVLNKINAERPFTLLIHGDAGKYKRAGGQLLANQGADALAGRWASEFGIQQVKVPANWTGLGKAAGMKRNHLMLSLFDVDLCIGFAGGVGTNSMMYLAHKKDIEVIDAEDL